MADDANPNRDYRDTVFLPNTPFPMRAGLPRLEPEILERWRRDDLYAAMRRAARTPARPCSCCTTARPTPTARSTSGMR